jgi:hypothetical protein
MPRNIGAVGICGVAFETVYGTFVPSTKFFPINSETLSYKQNTHWRRPIRAVADIIGAVHGGTWVEGDVTFELTEDVLPYFLYCSRNTVVKSGTTPNWIYTTTPVHQGAAPVVGSKVGLSIAVTRNAETFGYSGCIVTGLEFTIDEGVLNCKATIIGSKEATTPPPLPIWPTTQPYGMDTHSLKFAGAAVTDAETVTITIDDAGEALFRVSSLAAVDVKWGERSVTAKCDRDFFNRTDFDAFKAYTQQSIELLSSHGANNSISIKAPVTIADTYEVNLSGQGDLVRGTISYNGVYDPTTSKAYEIVVKTQETIT